jgi:hypothetical protein
MNVLMHWADAWWPQWRSHWHVMHAWPVSAQVLFLGFLTLCMTLWLSWLVSGEAWQTYAQTQEREQATLAHLQALQAALEQHHQRVAALQNLAHPSGVDGPAWLDMPQGKTQSVDWREVLRTTGVQFVASEVAGTHHWRGSLPRLLVAWQTLTQHSPQTRVTGWKLSTHAGASKDNRVPDLDLLLEVREDAPQVLRQVNSSAHKALKLSATPALPSSHSLFNPFDTAGLVQGLPALPRVAHSAQAPDIDVSQWQWMGAASSGDQSRALLVHDGLLYHVTTGQPLGLDGGEISHIAADHLVVREWSSDGQGHWQTRTTRLPPKATP